MPSPYWFCVTWFRRLLIARPSRPSAWPMRKYSKSLNAVPNAEGQGKDVGHLHVVLSGVHKHGSSGPWSPSELY